jgi:hypothetical protein
VWAKFIWVRIRTGERNLSMLMKFEAPLRQIISRVVERIPTSEERISPLDLITGNPIQFIQIMKCNFNFQATVAII